MSADHNTTSSYFILFIDNNLIFYKSYFSSLMFDIVLVCRRPMQLQPMRIQIFTPTLAPVNPSLEKSPQGIVETDHTDHNILSLDAAETRQRTPGGLLPWISFGSQHNLFIFLRQYLTKVVFFVNVAIVLVCR
jgi:hypothetical protein